MTTPFPVSFVSEDTGDLAERLGTLVVFCDADKMLAPAAARVDELTGGALTRVTADEDFAPSARKVTKIAYPSGMQAGAVLLASLGADPDRLHKFYYPQRG